MKYWKRVFLLVLLSVGDIPVFWAQAAVETLEQAIRLIEKNNILSAAADLALAPEQIFMVTDISADGRYLRYELAGEEGFHEAKLITGRQEGGMLVCSVSSACGPICEQGSLQCYQVSEGMVSNVTAQILPRSLSDYLTSKINSLHEKAESSVPDENEPCPFMKRIILPREGRENIIKLGYVCGLQPEEPVYEFALLEYRGGKFVLRELP